MEKGVNDRNNANDTVKKQKAGLANGWQWETLITVVVREWTVFSLRSVEVAQENVVMTNHVGKKNN